MPREALPPHRLGMEANDLTDEAERVNGRLQNTAQDVARFRDRFAAERDRNTHVKMLSVVCFLAWLAIAVWEYHVSKEIYIEYVGYSLAFLPAVVLVLLATVFSAFIAEPFLPAFSGLVRTRERSISDNILGRKSIHIPPAWIFFFLGVLLVFLVAKFGIYDIARYRASLLEMAGELEGEAIQDGLEGREIQERLPVFLFMAEVLVGTLVPSFLLIVYMLIWAPQFSRKLERLQQKRQRFLQEARRKWEAYLRELQAFNRNRDTEEVPVLPSAYLRRHIEEYNGISLARLNDDGGGARGSSSVPDEGQDPSPPHGGQHFQVEMAKSQDAESTEVGEQDMPRLDDEEIRRNNLEL